MTRFESALIALTAVSGLLLAGPVPVHADDCALFSDAEQARLVAAVRRGKPAYLAGRMKTDADKALASTPHPIEKITTEGRLDSDPAKVATGRALRDMGEMQALGWTYEVTRDARYAQKAREFILAWARTNRPTGDPIDETNLEGLILCYDFTRAAFNADDRKIADDYLRRVVAAELGARQRVNNWQSHREKIILLSAYVLRDDALAAQTIANVKRLIGTNLLADGSSYDFHQRDALHYHVYDLEPLLTLAIVAHRHGVELYDYSGEEGGSLRKSVHFLLPYCTGEKRHPEFVHSTVAFDRQRAANGQGEYQSGHLFQPSAGVRTLCLAAYFDPEVKPALNQLTAASKSPAAGWNLVLQSVADFKNGS